MEEWQRWLTILLSFLFACVFVAPSCIFLRRLLTLLPAMIVIGLGLDPLRILVLSQVVLSFTLPFALVPLLILCGRRKLMGGFTNGVIISALGWLTVGLILALNAVLLGLSVSP